MSYEYTAAIDSTKAVQLAGLLDSAYLRERIKVIKAEPNEAWLIWRDTPPRTNNSPDVSVVRDKNGVYVAFHSATRSQREALLRELRERASHLFRLDLTFEEI